MRLSELPAELKLRITRDGEFRNLGFLSDRQEAKLVFLESSYLLAGVNTNQDTACVVTNSQLAKEIRNPNGIIETDNPRRTFADIHNYLVRETSFYGRRAPSVIDETARIHETAVVADNGVVIGPKCEVMANTWIGEGVTLGSGVKVHPGTVLGGTGLQVTMQEEPVDLDHAGRLALADGVVVMANAVIARAIFRQTTRIGSHSRIGNLAFVSHNVSVGPLTIVGHHSVINGNVTIGKRAWIGPNATIANNLTLGEESKISLGAVVIRDVQAGQRVTGVVAVEHRRMLRHLSTFSGPRRRVD
jgi:UDP-3-O-[3-hydroxymyristoyl] glucosamine N-acyltransferase